MGSKVSGPKDDQTRRATSHNVDGAIGRVCLLMSSICTAGGQLPAAEGTWAQPRRLSESLGKGHQRHGKLCASRHSSPPPHVSTSAPINRSRKSTPSAAHSKSISTKTAHPMVKANTPPSAITNLARLAIGNLFQCASIAFTDIPTARVFLSIQLAHRRDSSAGPRRFSNGLSLRPSTIPTSLR